MILAKAFLLAARRRSRRREPQAMTGAAGYPVGPVVLSVLALFAGLAVARHIAA